MTYDQWKTTDPRDYEPEQEPELTELESVYEDLLGTKEELKAAYARITKLEADLHECREYLEDHVDVVDGDYGQQEPNKAMQLVSMIDDSIGPVF